MSATANETKPLQIRRCCVFTISEGNGRILSPAFYSRYRSYGIWVPLPKNTMARLHTVFHQGQGICMAALIPIRRRQVGHTRQRRGMVHPEFLLPTLHHLFLQLLGLLPPALIPIRRRQVGHARERVGMIGSELGLASLHHLHLQLLGLLPPSLIVVHPAKRGPHKASMPSPLLTLAIIARVWKMHHQMSTELRLLLSPNYPTARRQNKCHIPPTPWSVWLILHRSPLHETVHGRPRPLPIYSLQQAVADQHIAALPVPETVPFSSVELEILSQIRRHTFVYFVV